LTQLKRSDKERGLYTEGIKGQEYEKDVVMCALYWILRTMKGVEQNQKKEVVSTCECIKILP
jgi:hypothetical protein